MKTLPPRHIYRIAEVSSVESFADKEVVVEQGGPRNCLLRFLVVSSLVR
jgi:hypothetical protein